MKDIILNPNLTSEQQSLTLHSVLKDPELSSIIKNAGVSISLSLENIAKYHMNQTKNIKFYVKDKRRKRENNK